MPSGGASQQCRLVTADQAGLGPQPVSGSWLSACAPVAPGSPHTWAVILQVHSFTHRLLGTSCWGLGWCLYPQSGTGAWAGSQHESGSARAGGRKAGVGREQRESWCLGVRNGGGTSLGRAVQGELPVLTVQVPGLLSLPLCIPGREHLALSLAL